MNGLICLHDYKSGLELWLNPRHIDGMYRLAEMLPTDQFFAAGPVAERETVPERTTLTLRIKKPGMGFLDDGGFEEQTFCVRESPDEIIELSGVKRARTAATKGTP